jgi:isochorismate synthase EntC
MELFKKHIDLYAGCGITKNSDANAEWIETENKLKTLGNFLP